MNVSGDTYGELTSRQRRAAALAAGPRTKAQQRAAHELAASKNRRRRIIGRPGTEFRRVIVEFKAGGYWFRYHATKGWTRLAGAPA